MANPFPIGAWVADQQTGAATRGMVKQSDGSWRFQPYRGEIVSYGHLAKHPAYIVQFGRTRGIILASAATCDSCGAIDERSHHQYCLEAHMRGVLK